MAEKNSSLITIQKDVFNECGNLKHSILYLNNFFESHPFFENESEFMIRVVSSISKLQQFSQGEVIIDEGIMFNEILFFVKGEAKVFKTLAFEGPQGHFT